MPPWPLPSGPYDARPDRLYTCEDLLQRVAPRSYPALLRQAERLRFADLLSVGDEPEQFLGRFPAVAAPASPGVTPAMLVRRMRNAG